ncbi:peptide deformylase [Buchnera aphidicola]|uniref:peptide deformylase n=1 Tax=Buchnera aphidicola TaxID=9 RepID=UPI003A6D6B31
MSTFKILKYPDKNLRKIAKPVKKINKKIKKIIHKMFNTMYLYNGIGLAATQVNINLQIIVIGIIKPLRNPLILINPKIINKKKIIMSEEGCLSVPKKFFQVPRYNYLKLYSLNHDGKKNIISAQSNLSFCIQHELDHLKGKLILDY